MSAHRSTLVKRNELSELPGLTQGRHSGLTLEVELWSLTMLREKIVKIGAKVVAHARYTVFQMAKVAVQRDLLRRAPEPIDDLKPKPVARCWRLRLT